MLKNRTRGTRNEGSNEFLGLLLLIFDEWWLVLIAASRFCAQLLSMQ
jgi:hypothetical protein